MHMRNHFDQKSRKRHIHLSLNEDLARQARTMTNNLSGVVELLLTDFVKRKKQQHFDESRTLETTIATWNAFSRKSDSMADEHTTL